MRSEADIQELRAIAAKAGTSPKDTEMVMGAFLSLRIDKRQAGFNLRFYAKELPLRNKLRSDAFTAPALTIVSGSLQQPGQTTHPIPTAMPGNGAAVSEEHLAGKIVDQYLHRDSSATDVANNERSIRPCVTSAEERLAGAIVAQYLSAKGSRS